MSAKIIALLVAIIAAVMLLYFILGGSFYFSPAQLKADPSEVKLEGCVGKVVSAKIVVSNIGGEDASVEAVLEGVKGKVLPGHFSVKSGSKETITVFVEIAKKGSVSGKLVLKYGSEVLEIPITVEGRCDEKCLLEFYEYQKTAIKAKVTLIKSTKSYEIYKIYYPSVNKEIVPALLVKPRASGKTPCIFFIHGLNGDKEKFLDFMVFLSSKGYASFSIDLPLHGERKKRPIVIEKDFIKIVIQAVFDIRRGLDYLESRGDIGDVALLGRSLGGIIGSIALGVESRFKAGILICTGGNLSYIFYNSALSSQPEKFKPILESPLRPYVEPLNYISFFNKPVQFHLGEQDNIIPLEAGLQLASRAKIKEVYTYKAGHGLSFTQIVDKILVFLNKYLPP